MGDKTVAVDVFEGNNLLLIDEGQRGESAGETGARMRFRNQLCEKGLPLEYSATFGQAVKGSAELTALYARCILFDYSYKYLTATATGKDYQILKIDPETKNNNLERHLDACLLAFSQRLRVYREQESAFRPFNIDKPLWIFVGGKMTDTLAMRDDFDIIETLLFPGRFVGDRAGSIERINRAAFYVCSVRPKTAVPETVVHGCSWTLSTRCGAVLAGVARDSQINDLGCGSSILRFG
jgi:hypothetical protein